MKAIAALVTVVCGAMTAPASADEDRDLAACVEIANSIDRLVCFDTAAKARGVISPEVKTESADEGKWIVETEASKVDDSTTVFLTALSDETVNGRLDHPEFAKLVLRCMENETDVLIWLAGNWYTDRNIVTTRIDKRKAEKAGWSEGNDHEWMFHPAAIRFIRELTQGSSLFVMTEPVNEGPVQMTFDLTGLDKIVGKLQAACHWH